MFVDCVGRDEKWVIVLKTLFNLIVGMVTDYLCRDITSQMSYQQCRKMSILLIVNEVKSC